MNALRIISPFKQANVKGIRVIVSVSVRNRSVFVDFNNTNRLKFLSLTKAHYVKDLEYRKPLTTTSFLSTNMSVDIKKTRQGIFSKIRNMFFDPPLSFPKSTLIASGHAMYFFLTKQLDFQYYIKEFDLPDTLNSYFILVTLHIWLCTVRLANQGSEGEIVRDSMVKVMWKDIEEKAKTLVQAKVSTSVRQALEIYSDTILYIFYSLDEGLLSDDKTLAGAIWRTIYEKREDVDPEKLELLVHYIRKQVHHIEKMDSNKLLSKGLVQFLNIHGDKPNERILRTAKKQLKL